MPKVDPADLASGLIIVAVGAFFFFGAYEYSMGTIGRMGPGFVPHWLGAVSMLLGGIITLGAFGSEGEVSAVAWRPIVAILAAIAAFALLLRPFGLIPTIFILCTLAMLGNPKATWKMILATSVVVALVCWAIFIELLALPMRPFWFR